MRAKVEPIEVDVLAAVRIPVARYGGALASVRVDDLGALALGHALGNSGTRLTTTLIHALRRRGLRNGVATMCVGGGQGIAVEVEVPI